MLFDQLFAGALGAIFLICTQMAFRRYASVASLLVFAGDSKKDQRLNGGYILHGKHARLRTRRGWKICIWRGGCMHDSHKLHGCPYLCDKTCATPTNHTIERGKSLFFPPLTRFELKNTNHIQVQKQRVIQARRHYNKRFRLLSRAARRFASFKWAMNPRSGPHSSDVCFYTGKVSLLRFCPITNHNNDFGSRGNDFQRSISRAKLRTRRTGTACWSRRQMGRGGMTRAEMERGKSINLEVVLPRNLLMWRTHPRCRPASMRHQ